jgi:hypothetical protein
MHRHRVRRSRVRVQGRHRVRRSRARVQRRHRVRGSRARVQRRHRVRRSRARGLVTPVDYVTYVTPGGLCNPGGYVIDFRVKR